MDPFTFSLLVVAVFHFLKNGTEDLVHVAKGTESPRHRRQRARVESGRPRARGVVADAAASRLARWLDPAARPAKPPKPDKGPKKKGPARRYFSGLWESAWDDARDRRAEKRERKAKDTGDGELPIPVPDPEAVDPKPEGGPDTGDPKPEGGPEGGEPKPEGGPETVDPKPEGGPDTGEPKADGGPETGDAEPQRWRTDMPPPDGTPRPESEAKAEPVKVESERTDRPAGSDEAEPAAPAEAENEPVDAEIVEPDAEASSKPGDEAEPAEELRGDQSDVTDNQSGHTGGNAVSTGQVTNADGLDPQGAVAFTQEVGAAGGDLLSTVENSVSNLTQRGVRGEPIAHLQRVQDAVQALSSECDAARRYFENHMQIQEVIQSDSTVGGADYLGIGQR